MATYLNQDSAYSDPRSKPAPMVRNHRKVRVISTLFTFTSVVVYFSLQSVLSGSTEHVAMAVIVGILVAPLGYLLACVVGWFMPK